MNNDLYTTYIGAKGVAFAWIGALIGPAFLLVGVIDKEIALSVIGVGSLAIVAASFHDGSQARKKRITSDYVVFTVVPGVLLLIGVAVAVLMYLGVL